MLHLYKCSETCIVLRELELSNEVSAVHFCVGQLSAHACNSQLFELFRAYLLLLRRVCNTDILFNALHHVVERTEVLGVQGELWVHVAAHFHDILGVDGAIEVALVSLEVESCGTGFASMLSGKFAGLFLRGIHTSRHFEWVRDLCHLFCNYRRRIFINNY